MVNLLRLSTIYKIMDNIVDFLSKFELKENTEFVNNLDRIYLESMAKGQTDTLAKLEQYFTDKNESTLPKDIMFVKIELDTTVGSRQALSAEVNVKVENKIERDGYLSGNISILNECYTYLLRYSTHLAIKDDRTKS
jgi:hypothetical protein